MSFPNFPPPPNLMYAQVIFAPFPSKYHLCCIQRGLLHVAVMCEIVWNKWCKLRTINASYYIADALRMKR